MWRFILTKVPGSSPGNDEIRFFTVVIPGLEPGTSLRMCHPIQTLLSSHTFC